MTKTDWPLSHCQAAVERRYGRDARHLLGDTLYEALLDSELTRLCANQDESIDPATITKILRQGRSQIVDHINKETTP